MEKNVLKKWLDKLQEESWNLELIISGFSILGLFKAKAFLDNASVIFYANDIQHDSLMAWFQVFFWIIYASVVISIIFLLVHVFLRGLWIGAIGIRYVSGEIDYDKLNYNPSITNYLRKKLGNFDDYILKLEKASSLIFGYTFLLIMVLCSSFLYFLFMWIIINPLSRLIGNSNFGWISGWFLPLLTLLLALFIIIDFFSGGAIKKINIKWFSKTYIFLNKVVSWITLSFLWKPLYFNLIDRKKTKWLIYFVIPIFALLSVGITIKYNAYSIFPKNFESDGTRIYNSIAFKEKSRFSFQTQFYDNLRKQNEAILVMSLQNNKIESKSMELFVKLSNLDEEVITKMDSTIKPIASKGFKSYLFTKSSYEEELISRKNVESNKDNAYYKTEQQLFRENLQKILTTAKKIYAVRINGELIDSDSIDILFHQHSNHNEEGFLLLFNAENIEEGLNLLTLEKLVVVNDENKNSKIDFTIPFIYTGN